MKKKSGWIFVILLCSLFSASLVQARGIKFYVSGRINDAEGKPVHLAELFISGSSVGTSSDEKGKFQIEIPFLPAYLVVTANGYEPFAAYLDHFIDSVNVKLNPSVLNPADLSKVSKSERKKQVRFFCQQFIGDDLRVNYKVLNEAVLHFSGNDKSFEATSEMPLVIINNNLGYKIRILLREFFITKRDELTREEVPLDAYSGVFERRIMGHYYYEPITTGSESQQKRFERNRQNRYYGSYRHFLKSLYDGEVMDQGYQLTFYPAEAIRNGIVFTNLNTVHHSPSGIKECEMNTDSLKVDFYSDMNGLPVNLGKSAESYNKQTSVIYPSPSPLRIRPNGAVQGNLFDVKGPMSDYYFINSLPDDYLPPKKK